MQLALIILSLLSLAAAQKDGLWRFRITVTSWRNQQPSLAGGLDYDKWGIAGFNRGGSPAGLLAVRSPTLVRTGR